MSDRGRFWLAIQSGDLAAVKRLIHEDGSLLDERADSGHTPLRMACDCGQQQLAAALLELGAKTDVFDACALGDSARALSILDGEPELLCAHSHDGWTPLHLACFFGSRELVAGLLERGAPVTAISRNPTRNTPLHAALAGVAPVETVLRLIDKGADVNAVGGAGATPLHLGASRGNQVLVDLLLARGARSRPMEDGQTPASIARDQGFPELADRLESD